MQPSACEHNSLAEGGPDLRVSSTAIFLCRIRFTAWLRDAFEGTHPGIGPLKTKRGPWF